MPQNPRLIRATRGLERRIFLKALAVGLSVPLAAKLARAATAAPSAPIKRFFVFYMPHGIAEEHYAPQVSAGDRTNFTLNQTNISILGPLEQYKSYVNVYQGFRYVGGSTHEGIVNCLSGKGGTDTTTPRITVDQVIAKGLGAKGWVLGACSHQTYAMDNHGMLFWDGSAAIDPQKDPVKAYDTIFGNTKTTVNADVLLRQALLGLTEKEVTRLQSELSGLTSEQNKLQAHLDAIHNFQNTGASSSTCSSAPTIASVEKLRSASATNHPDSSGANDFFYKEENFRDILQAQLDLVAQALICGAVRVVGLMPMYATCDFNFQFTANSADGSPPGGWAHHNGLSHTQYQASPNAQYNSPLSVNNFSPTVRAAFARAQLWFAQQLVNNVVAKLATTDDPTAPGTKVLDNTLVYWMSEIGDGADHTTASKIEYPQVPSYLPLVSIGKCGGALKTGQIVNVVTKGDGSDDRPAGDLYATFCKAMGVTATFPDQTTPGGVVTEVLA